MASSRHCEATRLTKGHRVLRQSENGVARPIEKGTGATKSLTMRPVPVTMGRGAEVAQSVEQRTENPRVIGSIPILGTFYFNNLRTFRFPSSDYIPGVIQLLSNTSDLRGDSRTPRPVR